MSRPEFANRAAYYMREFNAIHPFRDGNGPAQSEFIRELASHSGYALDWSRVTWEQMSEASIRSFQRGDNSGLKEAVRGGREIERKR